MSETLQTSFSNTEAKGRITLFRNYLDGGNGYYGRFNRNTVTMRTLIARIQARKAGTNELNVQEIAGFLKEEILAALRNGELSFYVPDRAVPEAGYRILVRSGVPDRSNPFPAGAGTSGLLLPVRAVWS